MMHLPNSNDRSSARRVSERRERKSRRTKSARRKDAHVAGGDPKNGPPRAPRNTFIFCSVRRRSVAPSSVAGTRSIGGSVSRNGVNDKLSRQSRCFRKYLSTVPNETNFTIVLYLSSVKSIYISLHIFFVMQLWCDRQKFLFFIFIFHNVIIA